MRAILGLTILAASYAVPMGLLYTCVPSPPPRPAQGPQGTQDMVAGCTGYGCEDASVDLSRCGDTFPCSVVYGAYGVCSPSRCIAQPGHSVGYCYAEACRGH